MKKSKKDVALVVQLRLNSSRVHQKMIKPFAGTTLIDILLTKLSKSKSIPKENIYISVFEDELKSVVSKYGFNIYHRSEESANAESGAPLILEWWDKIPHKYVVTVSACNPLLKIETIDDFYDSYVNSDKTGAFAVFEKKQYYWDADGKMIENYNPSDTGFNTKFVNPLYEAAHCLYASETNIIGGGYFMDTKFPPDVELVTMNELEAFDIDYEWQFKLGEILYREGVNE